MAKEGTDKKMSAAEKIQEQMAAESKIFGYSVNKFGAVKTMNLHIYKKMDKNKDLIADKYDRSERFVEFSDKDLAAITKGAKNPADEKLAKAAFKIKVAKISELEVFMGLFQDDKISDKATHLPEELCEALRDVKLAATEATPVDDSAVKAREEALEADQKALEDAQKAFQEEKDLFAKEKAEAEKTAAVDTTLTPADGEGKDGNPFEEKAGAAKK